MSHPVAAGRVVFEPYAVDLVAQELWRGARRVRCQRQPFRVLGALLERPGQLVTREELQHAIWGVELPADADHSLGIAMTKLREALGDSAESPRFIETLSRRGYRFIAPVTMPAGLPEQLPPDDSSASVSSGLLAEPPGRFGASLAAPVPARSAPRVSVLLAMLLLGFGLVAGYLVSHLQAPASAPPLRVEQITHNDSIFPGVPAMESFPVVASDGSRLYSSILDNGRTEVAAIDPQTGEMQPLTLPSEIENPLLSDISPDGTRLLVRSNPSSDSEQPLWVVPREGGSALRVGNVRAHDAIWMPDGQSVLYAVGDDLDSVRLADGTVSHFASLPGRGFRMAWSPDGRLLRFTLLDPLRHTSSLWQIAAGGRPRPMLSGWTRPAAECCGAWTPDGRDFVFSSSHDGGSDLWMLRNTHQGTPVKLTNGPLDFTGPAAERDSHRIYFVGLDTRSELQRYDAAMHHFVPESGFLTGATRIGYSRDRQWVAWVDSSAHLWRARAADGTEKVQLTSGPLQAFLAHWSPDEQSLMVMARQPGRAWQLYQVSAAGGVAEPALREDRNEADPTWSPDGKLVAFGRTTDLMGREPGPKQIEVLNLATHAVTPLPGSEGMFSPRWSPDGRWIAALTLGEQRLMLYDTQSRAWRPVADAADPHGLRGADPVWAPDGSGLYIHEAFSRPQSIVRVEMPSARVTTVATLTGPLVSDKADYVFTGLARDDAPLVRVRTATANLYSMLLGR